MMGHAKPTRLLHRGHTHGSFEGRSSRNYDVVAHRFLRGVYRRIADELAVAVPPDGAVLDVGTGPGLLLVELARRRKDLWIAGIDRSVDMVLLAQRNTAEFAERISAYAGNVTDLPFDPGTFDVVATTFSLHHWDDLPSAVAEVARVLRPGGRFCVYDFRRAPFEALDEIAAEKRLFDPAEHAVIRTGPLHLWRVTRHGMSLRSD